MSLVKIFRGPKIFESHSKFEKKECSPGKQVGTEELPSRFKDTPTLRHTLRAPLFSKAKQLGFLHLTHKLRQIR